MKKIIFSHYKKIIILLCLLIVSFINSAWALNLPFLNKAKTRLSITPGESGYGEIVLENPTAESHSMRAYLEDWYYLPGGDGPKEFLPPNTTPLSCVSWISFSPSEFTLPPFGRQKLSYAVKVPTEAKGGYYAVMFFEGKFGKVGDQKQEGVAVGIDLAVRIASLFYVEAKGTINRSVEISNLVLNKENFSSPLSIQLDLRNTGNVDVTASGSFHIIDNQGMVMARGEFNNGYTFPQDNVKLTSSWKEPLAEGRYDLVVTIDIGKALEEAGMGRGPVITKEAEIEIGKKGEVSRVGKFE